MTWTHALAATASLTGLALAQAPDPAQQSPRDAVRLSALPRGVFVLRQGPQVARLNLQGRLNGCTTGLYDGSDPASRPSGGAARTRVIDLVRRQGFWYLTFQATLNGGCNVQGLCGAGTNTTLVWLKLDSKLRALATQAREIENCVTGQELVRWTGQPSGQDRTGEDPALELRGGVLETTSRSSDDSAKLDTTTTVRYSRAAPEQGLRVFTRQAAQK